MSIFVKELSSNRKTVLGNMIFYELPINDSADLKREGLHKRKNFIDLLSFDIQIV